MDNADAFFEEYCRNRARLARFKIKEDFETVKTVSVIEELLNRAETVHSGASTKGRYGWDVGHNIENYNGRANRYLSALERGEYPLRGMLTEPHMAMVDHCFIEHNGVMHLFYNRDYIGFEWDTRPVDTVGHATTEDLINWRFETPILTIDPDLHENYQIWSPGIAKKGDTFYLYYTGVNFAVAQAICLATSKDLYHWDKYQGSPVVYPGKWGQWQADRWSDCRDPMVFVDDDGMAYMYYCTAMRDVNGQMTSAVGIATSSDMYHWEDRGAYHFDICDINLESPFMIKHNGLYYLFYTNCNHGTAYAVSDSPLGNWKSMGMLIEKQGIPANPANVPSCAEVFQFKDKWYISSAERQPGCEQYIELFEFRWNDDGSVSVGQRLE